MINSGDIAIIVAMGIPMLGFVIFGIINVRDAWKNPVQILRPPRKARARTKGDNGK